MQLNSQTIQSNTPTHPHRPCKSGKVGTHCSPDRPESLTHGFAVKFFFFFFWSGFAGFALVVEAALWRILNTIKVETNQNLCNVYNEYNLTISVTKQK